MSRLLPVVVLCSCVVAAGCGGPDRSSPTAPASVTPPSSSTLVFQASPLDEAAITEIVPLGNLNPPGHTVPTDHIYVNNRRPGQPVGAPAVVYAPGAGTIRWIIRSGSEAKIGVTVGTYTYYLGHVELDAAIHEGMTLTAGQRVGQTGSLTYGIDLGVFNDSKTNFFANPARYPPESLHGEAPMRFFEEPLRSRLYDRVQRVGGDRDGRFDFDVDGYLVGNWYLDGLPAADSATTTGWSKQLAFVYDNYDPSSIRVSIGGTLGMVGAYAVPGGAPDPRNVSPASGRVAYPLLRYGAPGMPPGDQLGLLLVEMLSATRIKVEAFAGSTAASADFTSAALVYVR